MQNNSILMRIQSIVQDVLDNNLLIINEDTETTDVDGWDSLAHINIVSQVESEFRVQFSLGELANLSNVRNIIDAIREKS